MTRSAAGAHAEYLAARRFPSLDGLRCLAILPVVWHHATPGPLPGVLGKGPVGVDLFFALSGFLITTRLLRERDTGSVSLRGFYVRRTLRIFPAYYLVLGLYALRGLALLGDTPENRHFFASLPSYATYTSNWFVDFSVPHPVIFAFAWSLATEEQFYLVWPWALRLSRGLALPAAFMALLCAVNLVAERQLVPSLLPAGSLATRIAASFALPIGLGSLLALAMHGGRGFAAVHPVLGHRASAPVALVAVLALLAVDGPPIVAVHVALALLVGAVCARNDHGLRAVLESRVALAVGVVSYGMYLLHVSAVAAAKALLGPHATAPLVFAIAVPVAYALARISHRFVESPFLRLKARWPPPVPARSAAGASTR